MFSVQVIHSCVMIIDKDHIFCKNNFISLLTAGLASPFFGLLNDMVGIRVNSAIGMVALACIAVYTVH